MERNEYEVVPTLSGGFAVERRFPRERLAVLQDEALALYTAGLLNGGPVRSVSARGRWDAEREKAA